MGWDSIIPGVTEVELLEEEKAVDEKEEPAKGRAQGVLIDMCSLYCSIWAEVICGTERERETRKGGKEGERD